MQRHGTHTIIRIAIIGFMVLIVSNRVAYASLFTFSGHEYNGWLGRMFGVSGEILIPNNTPPGNISVVLQNVSTFGYGPPGFFTGPTAYDLHNEFFGPTLPVFQWNGTEFTRIIQFDILSGFVGGSSSIHTDAVGNEWRFAGRYPYVGEWIFDVFGIGGSFSEIHMSTSDIQFVDTTEPDPIESDASVPEPSTYLLFATGFLSLLGYGWRRKKRVA